MGAEKCYDNDLTTLCHTKTASKSSLNLNFDKSYVTKVRTINVAHAGNRERQLGADISIYDGDDDEGTLCGTIDDTSEREFTVDCNAVGSLVEILLKPPKPLHFSEVEIYGWGK